MNKNILVFFVSMNCSNDKLFFCGCYLSIGNFSINLRKVIYNEVFKYCTLYVQTNTFTMYSDIV